jgi:hypothetical protein
MAGSKAGSVGGVAYQAGRRREQQDTTPEPAETASAAAETPVASAPPRVADPTSELERLARLHQSGALTDDEFTTAKSRLLGV